MPTNKLKNIKSTLSMLALLLLILFSSSKTIAQAKPLAASATKQVLINPYILHIYDLNPTESSFKAIVWVNTTYHSKRKDSQRQIEFVNAIEQRKTLSETEKNSDGTYRNDAKYYVTIRHHFNLSQYPFDSQTLNIEIEDAHANANAIELVHVAPLHGSKNIIASSALPKEWKLLKVKPIIAIHSYNNSFSHTNLATSSSFSLLNIKLFLKRQNNRLFFSLFIMLYLSYLLSLFALIMPPTVSYFNTTSGLIIASVFSLVGNFIISSKLLLHTLSFTLIDKVQLITLLMMLSTYVVLIYNSYLVKANRIQLAQKIRVMSIASSITIYILVNILIFT